MSVIDMRSATSTARIRVGAPLSASRGHRGQPPRHGAYTALSNSDRVVAVNLESRRVLQTNSVSSIVGSRTMPGALALSPSGARLFIALSGADALAVIRVPGKGTAAKRNRSIVGRIPTAEQTEAVLTTAAQGAQPARLIYIAAQGIDTGPNPDGPNPMLDSDPIFWAFHPIPPPNDLNEGVAYGTVMVRGQAGLMALSSDAEMVKLTPIAERELHPMGAQSAPARTPLRAGGPIKHLLRGAREPLLRSDARRRQARQRDPKLLVFRE